MGWRFSSLRNRRRLSLSAGLPRCTSRSGVRTVMSRKRVCALRMSSRVTMGCSYELDFQDYRHNQRPLLGLFRDVALQVRPDLLLDDAVVGLLFIAGNIERLHNDLFGAIHQ